MAKLSTEDLLGQFKEMTLVELSEFVKSFETEFDVTAAAPVAAAVVAAAPAAPRTASTASTPAIRRRCMRDARQPRCRTARCSCASPALTPSWRRHAAGRDSRF